MSKETTKETTDFQGPISLDAIYAATASSKEDVVTKEETKEEAPKQVIAPDEIKEEKKEVSETKEVPQAVEEETNAFKTAKQLLRLGVLDDFSVQTSEDDDEGTAISEFKNMTEDNLEEIVNIHKQEKNNDISTKYISKEGLKEHQLKVIEILQNGGDLSQIAESPDKAFDRPFEGFDMDDQQKQIDVLYTDLVHSKGLKADKAKSLIDHSIKNGTLREESKEVFDMYREAHSNYIDDKLKQQRKDREFKDLNFKENKKSLVNKLKEAGLKESVYKKVSNEYSKKTETGEYALVDKLKNILDNPEENFEIIMHLADKKLFNETYRIKAAQESQKTIVRLASNAASKGNRVSTNGSQKISRAPWMEIAERHNDKINK